jgi:GT2 family glycosyltransferase
VTVSISVVVVAFRSGDSLLRCLRSLDAEPVDEVIVVDNGGGGAEIQEAASVEVVQIVSPGRNIGFAGGCNFGAARASGRVLMFLNPDAVVAPGAPAALAARVQDQKIGIAMARLRLLDQPELLNSSGTVVHLSGLAWAGDYGESVEKLRDLQDVPAPSGAAMAVRRQLFEELGGFTEKLFMYLEDVELGWRVRMRGLDVVVDPAADVFHEYEFGRNPEKLALLERNREVLVVTCYSLRLLVVLLPVLAAMELAMLAVAAGNGWFGGKLGGWWWCVRNARWLLRHRRATQRARQVGDRELSPLLTPVLDPKMVALPRGAQLGNAVTERYWRVASRLL